jgi:multidrug resistance efflux pump
MDRLDRGLRPVVPGLATSSGHDDASPESDDALWERLQPGTDRQAYLTSWFTLQCRLIRGARRGVVLLRDAGGAFAPAAAWPAGQPPAPALLGAAEQALSSGKSVVLAPSDREHGQPAPLEGAIVAEPIVVAGAVRGASVVEVTPRPEAELAQVRQLLRFGQSWLHRVLGHRGAAQDESATQDRLETVLGLLAAAIEHERFQGAATSFATELATVLGCERASIGFEHRGRIRVRALSHSAHFGERANLIRAIEAAMDEALDQRTTLVFPSRDERTPRGTWAHGELSRQFGAGAICTVPLLRAGRPCGAMTLERRADQPFDHETVALLEAAAGFAGPALEVHRRDDRALGTKIVESARETARYVASTRDVVVKLVAGIAIVALLLLAFATGEYRVTADTVLEPAVKRAAVAPFDGFVAVAPVRAGDVVEEGQILGSLDDRDLKLERLKWQSEEAQQEKQYRQALADRDAPQAAIVAAALQEARAELRRIEDRMSRVDLRAPFAGVVVYGDLTQKLGAPVQKGEVLFEVAPLDSYRLMLKVAERDIAQVAVGQQGTLVLSSLPHDSFRFDVRKITPVSTTEEGLNYFRVEAAFEGDAPRVQPGTAGVAKIEAGERNLVWIWTHQAFDWLRLRLWAWAP